LIGVEWRQAIDLFSLSPLPYPEDALAPVISATTISFWNSMRPNGGGMPTGTIADHIKDSFGDYAKFRQEFVTAAVTQFGSGWA
jgi:superoxide dismutase